MNTKILYPPTLNSTQKPVLSNVFDLHFSITDLNSSYEIDRIEVKINNWTNNKEIYRNNEFKYNKETDYITIAVGKDDFKVGSLYRIQMRFLSGSEDAPIYSEWSNIMLIKRIDVPDIRIINSQVINKNTKQVFKIETTTNPLFIGACTFAPENNEYVDKFKFDLYEIQKDERDRDFTIFLESSGWQQHNANADSFDSWRFKRILEPAKNPVGTADKDNPLYKVVYTISTVNGYEISATPYRLHTIVDNKGSINFFDFVAVPDEENAKVELKITLKEDAETDIANMLGNFVISRLDEKTGYLRREDLKYINIDETIKKDEFIVLFNDYTVENGVKYKYSIQRENYYGLRTSDYFANGEDSVIEVNFEHSYLYKDGNQLKIKFNPKISSFKYTTLAQKQDVLSGRYPVISRNKQAYYAEIPIGGLISFQAEDSYDFFQFRDKSYSEIVRDEDGNPVQKEDEQGNLITDENGKPIYEEVLRHAESVGYYYKDELVIPARKFAAVDLPRQTTLSSQSSKTDITAAASSRFVATVDSGINADNIFIEKAYRDKVLEFLNKEQVFLYKSPTEGNFIISLINVSTTPNQQLSRMISEFSATGYEIAETTLENMIEYNIWERGEKLPYEVFGTKDSSFGQTAGFFGKDINILSVIKDEIYNELNPIEQTGGSHIFDYFTNITLEHYPRLDLWPKYSNLVQKINKLEENSEKTEEQEKELLELKQEAKDTLEYINYFEKVPYYNNLIVYINGKPKVIPEGEILVLSELQKEEITSITVNVPPLNANRGISDYVSYTPLIINYTFKTKLTEMTKSGIESNKEGSFLFGQLGGIFEKKENDKALDNFNPYHAYYKIPRIYSEQPKTDEELSEFKERINKISNNFGIDKTKMKLYNSLDLYDLIDKECKQQIEIWYGENMPYKITYNGTKAWSNKLPNDITVDSEQIYYLDQIDALLIEAAPGTKIWVNYAGEQEKPIILGAGGKYKIETDKNLIGLRLDKPTYAIVNYSATTVQVNKVYDFDYEKTEVSNNV